MPAVRCRITGGVVGGEGVYWGAADRGSRAAPGSAHRGRVLGAGGSDSPPRRGSRRRAGPAGWTIHAAGTGGGDGSAVRSFTRLLRGPVWVQCRAAVSVSHLSRSPEPVEPQSE